MENENKHAVDLVPLRDSNYRAICREHAIRRNKHRHDPFAADFSRCLASYEEAFRKILENIFPSTENRILKHPKTDHSQNIFGFREIDFISVSEGEPTLFVELKFKEKFKEHRYCGVRQLRKSVTIGRSRWGSLNGLVVNVYLGEVYGLESEPSGLLSFDAIHDSSLQTRIDDQINGAWISGQSFMRHCSAEGLMSGKQEELCRARSAAINPLLALQTSAKNDFGSIGSQLDWQLAS